MGLLPQQCLKISKVTITNFHINNIRIKHLTTQWITRPKLILFKLITLAQIFYFDEDSN